MKIMTERAYSREKENVQMKAWNEGHKAALSNIEKVKDTQYREVNVNSSISVSDNRHPATREAQKINWPMVVKWDSIEPRYSSVIEHAKEKGITNEKALKELKKMRLRANIQKSSLDKDLKLALLGILDILP